MTIHLVGPGGAGKCTGVLLADRLDTRSIDLDGCFREREGDISDYLQRSDSDDTTRQNVRSSDSIAAVTAE